MLQFIKANKEILEFWKLKKKLSEIFFNALKEIAYHHYSNRNLLLLNFKRFASWFQNEKKSKMQSTILV